MTIEMLANLAAITTAIIAVIGYGKYQLDMRHKQKTLENYLEIEKVAGADKGQRSVLHIMAKLGLTEAEILQASFKSKHIVRRIAADEATGRASALLLEYKE